MRPSFLGLIFSGVLIMVGLILLVLNAATLEGRDWVMVVLLLSVAVAAHSILHSYEERWYKFNPMRGQWTIRDEPTK
jgi:hypothetical protein